MISGDLFDHNRVGDDVLSLAASQLARLSCPAVMIAGNHDALDWDYVALGHIHRHQIIRESPSVIAYSGATAESKEGEAAVVLVNLDPDSGVSLTLRELEAGNGRLDEALATLTVGI